ncbi:hypothetical protein ABS768_09095 [Flavobacterium sp. ST-75]|uniref:Uncharacterized protein n=1 Tax=Flavobacterium rhizophilum TaxID=3163296 RepID=A0ABW8YEA4_9FLAO
MRHLYLLLLFSYAACFSQKAKIIAYRLLVEDDDGPCSVKIYVEEYRKLGFKGFSWYVMAESDDEKLAERLLSLKKEAKEWSGVPHGCGNNYGVIGAGGMIHNMIVVEKEEFRDTLFTTADNNRIVFPEMTKAYIDEKGVFKESLTGIIKEFFEFDFTKDIEGMRMIDFPSENPDIVLFKSKNLKGFTKDKFEKQFGKLTLVDKVNNYGRKEFVYSLNGDIYTFEDDVRLISVEVNNPDSGWGIDGLSIGSKQELFLEKYPESMSFNVISSKKFEDYKKEQLHWLRFNESEGSIGYWIKDGVLNRFVIHY